MKINKTVLANTLLIASAIAALIGLGLTPLFALGGYVGLAVVFFTCVVTPVI